MIGDNNINNNAEYEAIDIFSTAVSYRTAPICS